MKLSYKIVLASLLLCPAFLWAQVIKGRVNDAATGSALANASVYIDGTSQGTITDGNGNFTLNNGIKSIAPLVVTHIGYESQKISNYAGGNLSINLVHKVTSLNEVTITSYNIRRPRAMRIFLKEFIGDNNDDCVILNPDDITFRYDKRYNLLTAEADKPLQIVNKTLGYKITYFLASFSYQPLRTQYKGNYFFTEDTAGLKPGQKSAVLIARDQAYFGSRMHFIRSLYASEPEKNGFTIYKTLKENIDYDRVYNLEEANKISHSNIMQAEGRQKFIMLEKDDRIYGKKFDKQEVFITYKRGVPSFLRQENSNNGIIIDSNGFYDEGLEWKGNLSVSRVNKLLPYEFMPSRL